MNRFIGRLQALWRALHIAGFRRHYEPAFDDPMLRATAAADIPWTADLSVAFAGGFLYTPVPPERFEQALRRSGIDFSRWVFIDLGCGRGRALVLASRFSFPQLMGVEISSRLAEDARETVARFAERPERVTVITGDARFFPFPEETPLFIFLYNPFGAPVLDHVLGRLAQRDGTRSRPVYILYFTPELSDRLLAAGFEQLDADTGWALFIGSPAPATQR